MIRTDDRYAMDETEPPAPREETTRPPGDPYGSLRRAVMARLFHDDISPEIVGRYRLEATIGSGGMGTVHAAHDPELDRMVAVKLLHWSRTDDDGKRLLREAKSLARLSHTNVVQVYDVGSVDGRIFLAMELVEGSDLRRWLGARRRGWREIVEVFSAAGEGLAAAHAAGLVHRDFKPENVLVRKDGVVKVADFGLVRPDGPAALAPAQTSDDGQPDPKLDRGETAASIEVLTRTGSSVGTPAYMSPEQHLALPTDARTDQYSFCVSLYEALYGRRPFLADTRIELIEATRADRVAFARRPSIPRKLRVAIRRGLRADPDARYPSMKALLHALRSACAPKKRWALWIVGTILLSLASCGGLLAMIMVRPAKRQPTEQQPAAAAEDGERAGSSTPRTGTSRG